MRSLGAHTLGLDVAELMWGSNRMAGEKKDGRYYRDQWRDLVASSDGPPSPTTRHVLLTMSLHMDLKTG